MRLRTSTSPLARTAFTLMEMMVVVAIIVILGGIVVVSLSNSSDKGNEAKAAALVKQIDDAALQYKMENHFWPPNLETLVSPDKFGKIWLKGLEIESPWPGQPIVYAYPGQNSLAAYGEDKPDVYIMHPSGNYMFTNWKSGKVPVTN